MQKATIALIGIAIACTGLVASSANAQSKAKPDKSKENKAWVNVVDPKPLSENVERGIGWLTEHQLESGAWGQGEESAAMGHGAKLKDIASVADTCMATLALLRSGSTPSAGPHEKQVLAAVNYICGEIEKADKDSLSITSTRGTRVQGKLGPYIDTFMACTVLSEVQNQMPDEASHNRASAALDKVLHKIQKNQREDGTWDDRGWAATLSQSMAVKGLNRAAQAGKQVDEKVREKAEEYTRGQFDKNSKTFSAKGTAGVTLYGAASQLGALNDSVNTNEEQAAELENQPTPDPEAPTPTPGPPLSEDEKQRKLARFKEAKEDLAAARKAVVEKLDDKGFVAGFGSNGGEEFLSYLNIGEALVVAGGEDWKKWDQAMTENLNRIQNKDGSWTGHHCITGRTFCTSAALLVLMVDRTPVPVAVKMKQR
jgi:hypothetical protein